MPPGDHFLYCFFLTIFQGYGDEKKILLIFLLSTFTFGSEHYFTLTSGAMVKITKPDYLPLNQSIYYGSDSGFRLNYGVRVQWIYNAPYEGILWELLSEIMQYGLLEDTSFDGSNESPLYIPPPAHSLGTSSYNYHPPILSVNNHYVSCVQISAPASVSEHTHLKSKSVTERCKAGTSSRYKCIFKNCDESFGRTNNRARHHKEHLQNYHYNGTCPVCSKQLKNETQTLLQHIAIMHLKMWNPRTH